MKNLFTFCLSFSVLLFGGLACQNNPFAKFKKQYKCVVTGETEPRTADEYLERAGYHFDKREDECFFQACAEAVRLDPKNAEAYSCRGNGYYFAFKDYDRAIADFTTALGLNPNDRMTYFRRGNAYKAKKMFDQALADYEKSLQLAEKDAHRSVALGEIAEVYVEQDKPDEALTKINEAISLNPNDYWNYRTRAKAYRKLGKNDLAEDDEQKADSLDSAKNGQTTTSTPSGIPITSGNSKTISGGVLNGKAVSLPKPAYPQAARAVRASGAVNVQVTVDERGEVVSASAVSGHPLLRASAVQAARQAKFSPTLLSGKPVKVTGVIVYNFVP
jgi:TonB family protein